MTPSKRRSSFGTKLRLNTLLTTGLALLLTSAGVMIIEVYTSRSEIVSNLSIRADYIGAFCAAALDFQDVETAEDGLTILAQDPFIEGAAVYDTDGVLFAHYTPQGSTTVYPDIPQGPHHIFDGGKVEMFRSITRGDEILGTIYLRRGLSDISSRLLRFGGIVLVVLAAALVFTLWTSVKMQSSLIRPVIELASTAGAIARNRDFSMRAEKTSEDELGELTAAFNTMLEEVQAHERALKETQDGLEARVRERTAELEHQSHLKAQASTVADKMRGELEPESLGRSLLSSLCPKMGALVGVIYTVGDGHAFQATGSYAGGDYDQPARSFRFGEGLIGQAAAENRRIEVRDLPADYLQIRSGIGGTSVRYLLVAPVEHEEQVIGVLELGAITEFSADGLEVLDAVLPYVGISLQAAISRKHTRELLEETQRQAEVLQKQQEELRVVNEELEGQTRALKRSQEQLQSQQEELQVANEELEEQKKVLEEQKRVLEQANQEIEAARRVLQKQTRELAQASQYKSEFLANMSHELRTPLNSLLILSRMLSENKAGNLTAKQVDYAQTIQKSGKDLLDLINDILDLSKVEAGRLELNLARTNLAEFRYQIERTFRHMAEGKGLEFVTSLDPDLPEQVETDTRRVEQILKNLLSNATKFCHEGTVSVKMSRPPPGTRFYHRHLRPSSTVAIAVSDTGIGIPKSRQTQIFEAFQQADSGISRRYGGTGLGLSISRELARILGGEIHLESTEGQGSTFTLYIPDRTDEVPPLPPFSSATAPLPLNTQIHPPPPVPSAPPTLTEGMNDGAGEILLQQAEHPGPGAAPGHAPSPDLGDSPFTGKTVLLVDDDMRNVFALTPILEERGAKVVVGKNGREGIDQLLLHPEIDLVLMDVMMPEMDGIDATREIRSRPEYAELPIVALTAKAMKGDRAKCLDAGASDYLAKPVDVDRLLAVIQAWLHRPGSSPCSNP